jgi:hypothetical protein
MPDVNTQTGSAIFHPQIMELNRKNEFSSASNTTVVESVSKDEEA